MLISIDCSIAKCGFAVIDGAKIKRSGVITTNDKDTMTDRLFELSEDLKEILGHKDHTITEAVIETRLAFSYKRSTGKGGKPLNQAALHKNSEAIGAIRLTFRQWGIPVHDVEATLWKAGRPKEFDKMIVSEMLGRPVTSDEADACRLGLWFNEMGRAILRQRVQDKERSGAIVGDGGRRKGN